MSGVLGTYIGSSQDSFHNMSVLFWEVGLASQKALYR